MPRLARVVIPNCAHHVTQRGNHRRTVFCSDSERIFYLKLLQQRFSRNKIQVLGFVLMGNHVHHILVPKTSEALARAIGRLHYDFARWQHLQRNLLGHFWQNRFFSCPMDEDHLWEALRYVELNPVRAGLVEHAWDWPWSSAETHCSGHDDIGFLNLELWSKRFTADQWKAFLEEGLQKSEKLNQLRLATQTGRPLGDKDFIARLEEITGRLLKPKKPGPKLQR